jgi:hypothetical protein
MKTKKRKPITVGQFILRDNSTANTCRIGQEKGIILDDKYYLDTTSLIKYPLNLQDAKRYSKQVNMLFPTKKQLQLLASNIAVVIESLRQIGYHDYLLADNLCQECWMRRNTHNHNKDERRRVLFIMPV